jgi:hypothetical protein
MKDSLCLYEAPLGSPKHLVAPVQDQRFQKYIDQFRARDNCFFHLFNSGRGPRGLQMVSSCSWYNYLQLKKNLLKIDQGFDSYDCFYLFFFYPKENFYLKPKADLQI